ncbi:unnamed protein product [Effrenium voratum]|nr:unnamed protein product [Effrenium voratum]
MFSTLEATDRPPGTFGTSRLRFEASAKVINEGDNGDFLFVIEKGALNCLKSVGGEEKVVKTVNEGDVFGELALLYNCPRAASVVAKDECICWQLDRESFNHIVKDAAVARRNKYDEFLRRSDSNRSEDPPGIRGGSGFFFPFFLRGIQRVVGIWFFKGQLREGWGLPRERFDEGSVPFMVTQKRFGRHMMRV